MEKIKFIEILKQKGILHRIEEETIVITKDQGNVYLQSLTTLPDNVQFNNQGYVYLQSLTTLPDNVQFNNQGSVDLESLTTMPDNVQFNNQGYVYLQSLTTMPDNVQFNNQGNVYLESLNNKTINYQGKKIDIKRIDGYTMIIKSSKKAGDFMIHNALYFKGGDFKNMPKCVIAEKDGYFAHGDTIKSAISDCNFKFLQANFNLNDIVKSIKEKQTVTTNEYRLLTGACSLGVAQFMKEKNITAEELPLEEVIHITDGYYGNNKMKELFGGVR